MSIFASPVTEGLILPAPRTDSWRPAPEDSMFSDASLAALPLLVFPLGAIFAGIYDVLTLKIPNFLTGALALLFFPCAFLFLSWEQFGTNLLAAAAILFIGVVAFSRGWVGGGDAKLCAVCTLWIGWPLLMPFLFWMSLLGGALALICIILRSARFAYLPFPAWTPHWLLDAKSGIPYGAPMAIAAAWIFLEHVWSPLLLP